MTPTSNLFRIAGITVEMNPRFEPLLSRAVPYAAAENDRAVANIDGSPEFYADLKRSFPGSPDNLLEYMGTGSIFYRLLLYYSGMMLHASAVEMDGKAYLFSAASGTGKSTHAALWLREFKDRAHILNDDKPALRFEDGAFCAYGTPWSGKTPLSLNRKVPLQGIAFLERSETNRIRRISAGEALPLLLEQTVRPKDPALAEKLFAVLDKLLKSTPVYRLSCNMDPEAAHLSYQTMKEGKAE